MSRSTILLVLLSFAVAIAAAADDYILRTDPPAAGASVFVDGVSAGMTDDNGKIVVSGTPGTHEIRVDVGDESYTTEMDFDAELNALPPFVVERPKPPERRSEPLAQYTIDTNVADAAIFVEGEARGTTDSTGRATLELLPRRRYSIEIRRSGFQTRTTTITVPATGGQLSVELQKQTVETSRVDAVLVALVTLLVGSIVLLLVVALRSRRGAMNRTLVARNAAAATPNAGHFDRYQLAGTLGSGGIGTIYRAADLVQKNLVALKVLDARWLSDPDMVRKFLAEGEALRTIAERDPRAAVVKCFRYGREHDSVVGRPFIALELLEGETLQNRLMIQPALDEQTYVAIAYQIAAALIPVHGAGIVHRDLTPDNIFLRKGELVVGAHRFTALPVVVLIDFGIARQELLSRMTMDGSIAGKPHFMSPEQCRGLTVDARSDLYSLGIMLYLMAAGRLPFGGRDVFEVMRAQQADEPPPLPTHVNSRYADLCRRLLQKDRDSRPGSATSAASELEELLVSISTGASVNVVSFPNRRVSL